MDCIFLIPHTFERQILLVPHPKGFSLPRWALPATWADRPAHEHQRALLLNQAVYEQFGLTTAVLLITSLNAKRLVIFDTLSLSRLPLPAGRWVSAEELPSYVFAEPDQRAILEAWFAGEEEAIQHTHMPWQKRGWFAETTAMSRSRTWTRRTRASLILSSVHFACSPTSYLHRSKSAIPIWPHICKLSIWNPGRSMHQ